MRRIFNDWCFSLRGLLIGVTICACVCGFATHHLRGVEKQRAAIRQIEMRGGICMLDYECGDEGMRIEDAQPPGPSWLRAAFGDDVFANVRSVMFLNLGAEEAGVRDTDLEHLRNFEHLEFLAIVGGAVTDDGLQQLSELPRLSNVVVLRAADVSDEGLRHLSDLPELRRVGLGGTRVTQEGARRWKQDHPRVTLNVDGTEIR